MENNTTNFISNKTNSRNKELLLHTDPLIWYSFEVLKLSAKRILTLEETIIYINAYFSLIISLYRHKNKTKEKNNTHLILQLKELKDDILFDLNENLEFERSLYKFLLKELNFDLKAKKKLIDSAALDNFLSLDIVQGVLSDISDLYMFTGDDHSNNKKQDNLNLAKSGFDFYFKKFLNGSKKSNLLSVDKKHFIEITPKKIKDNLKKFENLSSIQKNKKK